MEVKWLAVGEIKAAMYNPEVRTDFGKLKELQASIQERGIIVPLLVTKNKDLIDGHRRLACAVSLGHEYVPTLEVNGDQGELFTELNGTMRKMNNSEMLYAFLHGASVPDEQRRHIETIIRMVGISYLKKLEKSKGSAKGILGSFRPYLRFLGKDNPNYADGTDEFANKFARWLIDHKQVWKFRVAQAAGMTPKEMLAYIENNKPLPRVDDTN